MPIPNYFFQFEIILDLLSIIWLHVWQKNMYFNIASNQKYKGKYNGSLGTKSEKLFFHFLVKTIHSYDGIIWNSKVVQQPNVILPRGFLFFLFLFFFHWLLTTTWMNVCSFQLAFLAVICHWLLSSTTRKWLAPKVTSLLLCLRRGIRT